MSDTREPCTCGAPIDYVTGFCRNGHVNAWVLQRPAAAPAVQPDSGTLREQIARALEETHLGGYGKSTWELMAAEVMAVVAPLVERLHQAEAAATKFDERLSDVQAEHCKALASWDRQRGSLTAERDQLRADLAAERAAHVTTAQLGTMHSRAAEALRTKQIQLNRDLTEARRELALAAAEAEDARDGGMELALELAEARACERRLLEQREEWWRHFLGRQRQYSDMLRGMARRVGERRRDADRESKFRRASEIEMMAEVERLEESRFRWAEEAAELERQRDEAREKGHGLLDDLVREQTARANAEADVRKAIERAGGSWRATVEAPTDAIALLYRAPKDAIALLYPDMANEDKTVGDLPAEEWQRFHAGVTGARRAETPDVHARVDELERALEDAPGAEHAKEWNADSTGTGGQA